MKTHVHLVLWPAADNDLSRFMHWLDTTHAWHWHHRRGSTGTGAVYQGRYLSKPILDDRHYFTVLRYVERNAVTAGLVETPDAWRWCSAGTRPDRDHRPPLSDGPIPRPSNWLDWLTF